MMLNRPQRSRASVRIFQASASVIVALCASSALAIPKNSELMPLIGGLKVGNIRANPNVFAYPLQTTLPIAGFQPLVVTTLTDEWFEEDDFNWYTHTSSTPAGNTLPNNSNPRYTFLSTLDSGGQTHIMSAEVAAQINLEAAGRAGSNVILATGAAGTEELTVSDPIGLYTSGFQNVTGAGLSVNPNAWRGHYGVSIATASDESAIPNIVGSPLFADYAVNIRNSQTKTITVGDQTVRSPSISFHSMGSAPNQQLKLNLQLLDFNGSSGDAPFFFPNFEDIENLQDDPVFPTLWTFPFAETTVRDDEGESTEQFLFDTGAQVTVLSTETANEIGFDIEVEEPDFYVDVLGAGGTVSVPGFFLDHLQLDVIGGDLEYDNVPVLVLDLLDPRDGSGPLPGILGMNLFNDRDLSVNLDRMDPWVRISNALTAQWNVNAGGDWTADLNWSLGSPNGVEQAANFLGAITSAKTINVNGDFMIGHMTFDNTNSYTIAGAGHLTFATIVGPSQISVLSGSHTLSAPMTFNPLGQEIIVAANSTLTIPSDIDALDAGVTKFGAGQLNLKNARFASLSIEGGTVKITAGAGNQSTSKVGTLSVSTGAKLDLTDSKFIVTEPASQSVVRDEILAQRITSSLLNSSRAIGYAQAGDIGLATFGGMDVSGDDLLMRMTLKGDTNLDGAVNFPDLLKVAHNYGLTGFWSGGDFTFDGNVNFNDLLPIAQNYGSSMLVDGSFTSDEWMNGSFESDWALALQSVPEPGVLSLLMLGTVTLRRRR